jgi:hypothetical protein
MTPSRKRDFVPPFKKGTEARAPRSAQPSWPKTSATRQEP